MEKKLTIKEKLLRFALLCSLLAMFLLGAFLGNGCQNLVKGALKDIGNGLVFAGHFSQDVSESIEESERHN